MKKKLSVKPVQASKDSWREYVSKVDPTEACGMVLADWFSFDDGWNAPSDEPESFEPAQPEYGLKAQRCWWRKVGDRVERVRYSPYNLNIDSAAAAMPPGWVMCCDRCQWSASNGYTDEALKVTLARGAFEVIDRLRLAAKARLLEYHHRGVPTISNIAWHLCPVVHDPIKRRDMLMQANRENQE